MGLTERQGKLIKDSILNFFLYSTAFNTTQNSTVFPFHRWENWGSGRPASLIHSEDKFLTIVLALVLTGNFHFPISVQVSFIAYFFQPRLRGVLFSCCTGLFKVYSGFQDHSLVFQHENQVLSPLAEPSGYINMKLHVRHPQEGIYMCLKDTRIPDFFFGRAEWGRRDIFKSGRLGFEPWLILHLLQSS